ncbi:hypothetical protein [Streptomyces sp. NPDC046759]|uniref:hypothetical protein n=1 Tax=Streptomyces sp. NPDC046759 TaxID=3155019 RepID=UPI0033DC9B1A
MSDRAAPALSAMNPRRFTCSSSGFAVAAGSAGRVVVLSRKPSSVACTARLVAAWEDGDVQLPRAVYDKYKVPSSPAGLFDDTSSAVREAEQHVRHCWQQLQSRVDPPE